MTRQTLLVRAEDACDCDADSEEEEEKEKVHVRKRDVVACELITTSTTTRGKKSRRKKKGRNSPPRHRIVITSFPRRKRLIDYATLPRFCSPRALHRQTKKNLKRGKRTAGNGLDIRKTYM